AVTDAIASKYRNTGQTCVCTNRFLVQAGIHDQFVEKLAQAVAGMQVGNGMEDGVVQGPLINEAAVRKVERLIADVQKKGGHVAVGGKRHALGGLWFEPTVLTGVTPDMDVARQEIFGPVAPVFKFQEERQAIAMANDTELGLAA